MIFHETYQKVLDGTKTQTRRPVKNDIPPWQVGSTYAVQPGRGKRSLGRILVKDLRLEHVQSISYCDLIAEGLKTDLRWIDATMDLLSQWEELWNSLYAGTEFAYEKNPKVWVLEFELVEKY